MWMEAGWHSITPCQCRSSSRLLGTQHKSIRQGGMYGVQWCISRSLQAECPGEWCYPGASRCCLSLTPRGCAAGAGLFTVC